MSVSYDDCGYELHEAYEKVDLLVKSAPELEVVVEGQGLCQNYNHSLGGELSSRNHMLMQGKGSENKL